MDVIVCHRRSVVLHLLVLTTVFYLHTGTFSPFACGYFFGFLWHWMNDSFSSFMKLELRSASLCCHRNCFVWIIDVFTAVLGIYCLVALRRSNLLILKGMSIQQPCCSGVTLHLAWRKAWRQQHMSSVSHSNGGSSRWEVCRRGRVAEAHLVQYSELCTVNYIA